MKRSIEQEAIDGDCEDDKGSESRRIYNCPYKDCEKMYTESGNLKAHIRTHVSFLTEIDW